MRSRRLLYPGSLASILPCHGNSVQMFFCGVWEWPCSVQFWKDMILEDFVYPSQIVSTWPNVSSGSLKSFEFWMVWCRKLSPVAGIVSSSDLTASLTRELPAWGYPRAWLAKDSVTRQGPLPLFGTVLKKAPVGLAEASAASSWWVVFCPVLPYSSPVGGSPESTPQQTSSHPPPQSLYRAALREDRVVVPATK